MALTKKELITAIADQAGLSKNGAETMLAVAGAVLLEQLHECGELTLPGIGKFTVVERAARTGRNPRTGEPVEISAKRSVKFAAAKPLKDALN
ncbi:HU family DNA-binding protein [Alcaligenaceae bacterium]|nr:HU family DNA-binding protein [Alcaligenaceae bacterium]